MEEKVKQPIRGGHQWRMRGIDYEAGLEVERGKIKKQNLGQRYDEAGLFLSDSFLDRWPIFSLVGKAEGQD